MYCLNEMPVSLWMLDNTTIKDLSGHTNTLAGTSANTYHPALLGGASRALIFDNGNRLTTSSNVYGRNYEHLSFSVSVAVKLLIRDATDTSVVQVWGHAGEYDGLTVHGTIVSFSTKYENTGEAKCSYDLKTNRAVMLVGVHTATKNSLYVDGEMVASVDITPEQQADKYKSQFYLFSSGQTLGTSAIALNGLATFRDAITHSAIRRHYEQTHSEQPAQDIVRSQQGSPLEFTPDLTAPVSSFRFNTTQDFMQSTSGCVIVDDMVLPAVADEETVDSSWTTVIPVPEDLGTLYGAIISWVGDGLVVETSTDGVAWDLVVNGGRTPTIPNDTAPVEPFLYVRARFLPGLDPDIASLNSLSIDIYDDATLGDFDGRAVTMDEAVVGENRFVTDYHENWGVGLNDGSVTIGPRTESSMLPKTIEMWVYEAPGSNITDSVYSATPTASYSNGSPTVKSYAGGEWQLRTYVFSAGFSGDISVSGAGRVGMIAFYDYQMSPDEVARSYLRQVGSFSSRLAVAGSISVVDASEQVDLYEYEWAVVEA